MREPPDEINDDESQHLRGGAYGSYSIAMATIRLAPLIEVFDQDGSSRFNENPAEVAIFIHEYSHYIHNVSTAVGAEQTFTTGAMLGAYAQTLSPNHDGTALGSAGLSGDRRRFFELAKVAFRHFARPWNRQDFARATGLRIQSWQPVSAGEGQPALFQASIMAEVDFGSERAVREIILDAQVIEEGLAYLLETTFLDDHKTVVPDDATFMPYRILEKVVKSYAPDARAIDMLRLGLVALNSPNPGVWLMSQLGVSDIQDILERSLEIPTRTRWDRFYPNIVHQCSTKLEGMAKTFRGRGLLYDGIQSIVDLTRKSLHRRLREPFFDLPVIGNSMDWMRYFSNMQTFVPCEVINQRSGPTSQIGRDSLLVFGKDSDRRVEGRRAFQLAVTSMVSHLDNETLEILPSEGRRVPCPFYSTCTHKLRETRAEVCARRPWTSVSEMPENRCWFAQGMLGLMAVFSVSKDAAGPSVARTKKVGPRPMDARKKARKQQRQARRAGRR